MIKKKVIIPFILFIPLLTVILSCTGNSQESYFSEFEINDNSGTRRVGGIYIPMDIQKGKDYPVIYMEDGLVFKECNFKQLLDSLIENNIINPVIVACSFENKNTVPGYKISFRNAEFVESIAKTDSKLADLFTNHFNYFKDEFIPYIEKRYPVRKSRQDRIFFGTSNSADFGITLSMRVPSLIEEYWCFSPVNSNIEEYGLLSDKVTYRICWGNKEEIGMFDYFPSLVKDIRKRGGNIHSWVFNGNHDRNMWKYWFGQELKRRFPYN